MTYEEVINGHMYFPMINGADEGNIVLPFLYLLLAITRQNWIEHEIFGIISLGKIIGLGLICFGFFCTYTTVQHIKKDNPDYVKYIPIDLSMFFGLILYPLIYIIFRNQFYEANFWIIFVSYSLLFASMTMDLQIQIITLQGFSMNIPNLIFLFLA